MVKTCPICLEDIKEYKNTLTLNCNHIFHIDCYTSFMMFQAKEISLNGRNIDIKCPMCRAIDENMLIPLLEGIEDGMDAQLMLVLFISEIEDKIIKEFIPSMLCIIDGKRRFSKRSMINVLRKLIKDHEKKLRLVIKDIKQ